MKTKLYLFILTLATFQTHYGQQWKNLNSGINDKLTGVVFFGNTGIVSGENGLYYTLNGGEGNTNWKRFEILNNVQNSILYNNTEFTACYSNPKSAESSFKVYAVGQDRVNKVAVLMSIEFPSMAYQIIDLNGIVGSKLEDIKYSTQRNKYYAVGNNSLLIYFTNSVLDYLKVEVNKNYGDFTSLNYHEYGYNPIIGSQERYIDFNADQNTFKVFETPGVSHKDVIYHPNSANHIYSVSNQYLLYGSSVMYPRNNYFYGPLNGNEIFRYGTSERLFVGTDHGIFISNNGGGILQWQPSSSNYFINNLWNANGTPALYACGKDGVILKNELPLEEIEPYAEITFNGGCFSKESSHNISIIKGDTKNCKWYINNKLVNNSCAENYINYKFPNPGEYEIKLILDYNGTTKEVVKNIHILTTPEINKAVSISDDILCKIETTEIFIENSEPNVQYILKNKKTNEVFGTSPTGNGGTISLITSPIDLTGEFYFTAKNVLADCSKDFTDSFKITVEETEAKFVASLINAKQNETITFYNHSIDAQNFDWTFTSNGGMTSSNIENPQKSFSSTGKTEINFNVWSNNDCYHEITSPGPYIYQDAGHTENTWNMLNGGQDPYWEGYYSKDIGKMVPLQDGFLICGYNSNSTLNSNIGVHHTFKDFAGGYAAKYDKNGVLKWVVYTKHSIFSRFSDRDAIRFGVEDQEGNIYITGNSDKSFFDSSGAELKLDKSYNISNFIIKLDSNGKIIWEMQVKYLSFNRLFIDKENNLIATGPYSYMYANDIYLNGVLTDTIGDSVTSSPNSTPYTGYLIAKFDPNGSAIWDTPILISQNNGADIVHIGFDNANNLYVTGYFEYKAEFYSAGSNVNETINGIANNTGGTGGKLFLAKYNENGILQWKLRSMTYNVPNDTTKPYSMVTDDEGNCYISGSNSVNGIPQRISPDYIHTFENTDGSFTQTKVGGFFVAKVNSNGICEWIRGGDSTYYGYGYGIIKNGDEIGVLGYIANNGESYAQATFSGTDGKGVILNISRRDYFIAIYDTSGNLKRIIQNGENDPNVSGLIIFYGGSASFFKGEGKNYYSSFNYGFHDFPSPSYTNFGKLIPTSNGTDGLVTRFTEDNGIIYYPSTLSNEKFSINSSNYRIFPNPTQDYLNVTSKIQITKLEVYNSLGQIVLLELNKASIDVSSLNTGLHFIKILDAVGNSEIKKFIKE